MSIKGNADTNVLRGKVTGTDVICLDAYDIAVKNGFEGTEEEWLASLKGEPGAKGERGEQGERGEAGSIKIIIIDEFPTENIDETAIYMKPTTDPKEINTYDEFIYVDGVWENIGSASVSADMTDYVKKTDYATQNKGGIVKVFGGGQHGFSMVNGEILCLAKASESTIDNRTDGGNNQYRAVTINILDYAVKKALADCKLTTWTDEEKASARALLGVPIYLMGSCSGGIHYINQPFTISETKQYKASIQLTYDQEGVSSIHEHRETVTFTDGSLTLNLDTTGNYLVGVKIYANKIYDSTAQTFVDKDGWLCVESEMGAYSGAPYNYIVVLTEA